MEEQQTTRFFAIDDEAGVFVEANTHKIEQFRAVLEELAVNREEQKKVSAEIKLSSKLKTLQIEEKRIKEKLK